MDPGVTPHLEMAWTWHVLQPVTLLAWVLLLLCAPRTRASALLFLFTVGLHVATYTPRVHMHKDRAWWEILSAYGAMAPDYAYGDGWVAWMTWPLALLGWPSDGVHWVNSLVAALAVPHLYGLTRRAYDEHTAIAAAALFACAPLPLAIASTENRYVPLMTLEILAVHGLLRRDRWGDLMVIAGAGLVAHLRPLEGLAAVAIGGVAWAMGRRRAALGTAVLVGYRLFLWWQHPAGMSGLQLDRLLPMQILAESFGKNARAVIFDPGLTPNALLWLSLGGAGVGLYNARRPTFGLLALVLGGTLIYMNQPYLADRMRYQLPVQPWLCALAGIGAVRLARVPHVPFVLAVALVVSWWPARHPYPPFAWQQEHTLLRDALRLLPPGATVTYDDGLDPQANERIWADWFAGVHLVPLSVAPPDVRWRWVGLADHVRGQVPPPAGLPVVVVDVPAPTDDQWGCTRCDGGPIRLGLYDLGATKP